ncbi:SRPBCC family protein [Sphaerisporangium fuscum]|uniref:SRPBCC family protein n=1 Tax=Sphaerisporangium fuscum TaxID=2835868 RepID=UPI001BDBDA74|nr:SRPBCC domain-containing protein [Sphaerisporangium fuscum]
MTQAPEDRTAVHVDEFLPHPPEKVWRALTEPELIARWLMPNDFRLEVGHRYTMRAEPVPGTGFSGLVACEVLEFDPGKLLRVSWADGSDGGSGLDSTVTWRLEREGRGTRLFLDHEGFDPDDPGQQMARRIMGGGWRRHVLRRLDALLTEPS